ncbi:MAG: DUF624 domain-containing protein [Treponema sp.]|nr:DUF624 domain-containing protein [Treponema sp.]
MGIFNQNSKLIKFVNKIIDLIWLNFLWVIFSLPLITIGASTCAAFSVTLKMVDDEEGYIARSFIKAFRQNFKQATIMWCITAPLLYLAYLIWQVVLKADSTEYFFLLILGAILYTALLIVFNLYTYPLIARYENSLKNMIKNSLGICLTYFGRTVLILALLLLEGAIIFWNRWTILAGLFFGPEFMIFTISGIAKKIFLQIERHEDANSGTINQ